MPTHPLEPGQITTSGEGLVARLRNGNRRWIVVTRLDGDPEPRSVVHRARKRRHAQVRAQELRHNLKPNLVVDIYHDQFRGWRLLETLPPWYSASSTDDTHEIIWGHTAEPIAVVECTPEKGWVLFMSSDPKNGDYTRPTSRRDALPFTRADAIATARRLSPDTPPDDESWPDRWQHALRVTRAAGHATLAIPIQFVGPTGLPCHYPACSAESDRRISIDGSDIAYEQARLCCNHHAAVVSAPMFFTN